MVQLEQQQNGDTFGETEYLVSKSDIEDFRKGIEEEAQRDPDQFHPADVQKLNDSDELCRRFIRQKRRNVDDALTMAKAALCWRKKFEVNDITEANLPQVYFDFGAMFPLGKDKYGSQIIVHRVRLHRKNERMAKQMKRFLVFWVEKLLYEMDYVRITFILDCHGSGYANLDMDLISFLISLFKEYYPWALGFIMVYDMPWLFNTAWKVVKSWLPAEGVDRIKFVDRETITNYVPRENLPEYMGGKEKIPFREYTTEDVDFLVNEASPQVIGERIPRTKAIEEFYRSRFGMFSTSRNAAGKDAPVLVKVEPESELVFNAEEPDINRHVGSVVLTNTSDTHVAFKIKTNNIDGYKVKPFFGIIPLNSTVSVNVAQNPGSEFHPTDKLLIMTTGIDTLEISPRELIDHWRAVDKESIKEHRLRCINPGPTVAKITAEVKEVCSKFGPANEVVLVKDKSYHSFCPPSIGTIQLDEIREVVGGLQAKLGDVYQEVHKISRRQEHLIMGMGATLVILLANLAVLFVVKSCQTATDWYC